MRIRTILLFIPLFVYTELLSESWIFTKAKIQGALVGKDRFLQYYLISPGDVFDEAKHKHSVHTIEDELKREGYLHATVIDTVTYDEPSQTVKVSLRLSPGTSFTTGQVALELSPDDPLLRAHLQKKLAQHLVKRTFTQDALNREAEMLVAELRKSGYVHPSLSLSTKLDDLHGTVAVTFSLKLPAKKEIQFVGNEFYSDEFLSEQLRILEAHELPPDMLADELVLLYKRKGFFEARVTWKAQPGELIFTLVEGPRSSIERVTIAPQMSLPLLEGFTHSFYDEALLVQARIDSVADLAQQGYWDAEIIQKEPLRLGTTEYELRFEVCLGQQRTIRAVEIEGYPELANEALFKPWQGEVKTLSPQAVDEQRTWLLQYIRRCGFLYATVSFTIEDELLRWHIDTHGGQVRFGDTTVVGLSHMRPEIVLRELQYCAGDIWSREKLELTAARLKSLCMFESVSLAPTQVGEGVLPVRITCIEDDPYEIRTRLGFQFVSKSFTHITWSTYTIGGSFVWKNPTGMADRLFLDADLTRYTRNLSAAYEVPWLGSLPIRTLCKVYSDRFDQPLLSTSHQLYKEAHDGCSVTFKYDHGWWQSCVRTGFEFDKLYGISRELAEVIQFEPRLVNRLTPYLYIEPTITFEQIDNKIDPCRGIFTSLSLKAMVPPGLSDGWFVRALVKQSMYYPLYPSVIGAFQWQVGHIFNPCFKTLLPTERFYLGGACSLRGYEPNMAPPLNDFKCDDICFWVPVGGKSMVNINAEVRFPLYKRLSGVVFTDMGVLSQNSFADIAAHKWLGATGFGLRIATPLGPIRFDIGWKWRKRVPQDKSYAWFLTLGQAF